MAVQAPGRRSCGAAVIDMGGPTNLRRPQYLAQQRHHSRRRDAEDGPERHKSEMESAANEHGGHERRQHHPVIRL